MTNFEAHAVFVWGLIILSYAVPSILRYYNYDSKERYHSSQALGMYLLMMSLGGAISLFIQTYMK